MASIIVKYRGWEFLVDKELTVRTYSAVDSSGADTCSCNQCHNYVAYRDSVFPVEILDLFHSLGIDYRKEVEIGPIKMGNDLHHISGWFHFKGSILANGYYDVPIPSYPKLDRLSINDNFSIGFIERNDLAFFEDKAGLIQVEFETVIQWVIDRSFEPTD